MSDRAALLAAIRQFPEEDAPRLIYADWLDEHGESERAEFIRVQIELARLHTCACAPSLFMHPNCLVCDSVHALYNRRHRLLNNLYDEFRPNVPHSWAVGMDGDLPDDEFAPGSSVSRGFTEMIRCSAADWLAHADAILAEHPVRRVRLTDRTAGNPPGVIGTAGVLTKAVLTAKWPGIEFELQPPTSFQEFMQANFPPILPAGPITLTGTTS